VLLCKIGRMATELTVTSVALNQLIKWSQHEKEEGIMVDCLMGPSHEIFYLWFFSLFFLPLSLYSGAETFWKKIRIRGDSRLQSYSQLYWITPKKNFFYHSEPQNSLLFPALIWPNKIVHGVFCLKTDFFNQKIHSKIWNFFGVIK